MRINRELARIFADIGEYASDVSRSGVFLRSRRQLPVGTRIPLSFSVIIDDVETIRGTGVVVRVCREPRGMGVKFIELDSASRDVLARLLARASERGEARP